MKKRTYDANDRRRVLRWLALPGGIVIGTGIGLLGGVPIFMVWLPAVCGLAGGILGCLFVERVVWKISDPESRYDKVRQEGADRQI